MRALVGALTVGGLLEARALYFPFIFYFYLPCTFVPWLLLFSTLIYVRFPLLFIILCIFHSNWIFIYIYYCNIILHCVVVVFGFSSFVRVRICCGGKCLLHCERFLIPFVLYTCTFVYIFKNIRIVLKHFSKLFFAFDFLTVITTCKDLTYKFWSHLQALTTCLAAVEAQITLSRVTYLIIYVLTLN